MSEHFFESEIQTRGRFYFRNKVLSLASNISSIIEKLFYFSSYLWDNIDEYKNKQSNKYDIESSYDDICRCILSCDFMSTIFFSVDSPIVYFLSEIGPELEKNIGKKEGDEKEYEKITEAISDHKKGQVRDKLSPKDGTEYHWKCCFKGNHMGKIIFLLYKNRSNEHSLKDSIDDIATGSFFEFTEYVPFSREDRFTGFSDEITNFRSVHSIKIPFFCEDKGESVSSERKSCQFQISGECWI